MKLKTIIPLALCIISASLFTGCSNRDLFSKNDNLINHEGITIIETGDVDGRPTYSVLFQDGKALDYLYAEEIERGLATNKWGYDEDLKSTNDSSSISLVSLRPLDNLNK